ncbi:Ig-like domain-containing protein [Ruegeria sp. PrR005]|uniref:Tandem-95 repeat protein n=1 Tax=Ruegeria sp. PrR005 TaxID=2706882 RepID=A0A6B2NM53_9RHOB|nr:Ig-like domain-containing protein [Ruegeria sp. PrR005]NDW44310.1 tandem-95 repeat protein [Ruegeria sp. PrR005]
MAKFKGTNGDDAHDGSALDDDIDGKEGNDTLNGLGGDDIIRGQHGMDNIDGGDGNDTLVGHHDSDTVRGGDGDDVVFGDVGGNGPGSSYWNSSDGPGDGDSSDDLVDGGAGNDYVFGGGGDDEAIYDLTENAGAMDYYAGGSGIDTLTLTMTLSDWFRIEVQNDIAAFLNFVAANTDPLTGEANGQGFDFAAFGLTAREFEDMRVFVDGVELSPEDDPVTANDDSASLTEDDGDTPLGNVLDNDVVPDLVYQVALVPGPVKGILTFNPGTPGAPDGSFSYDPKGEFEYLAVGESEDVTFVYEVTDANRDTDQATVTITVDGVNDDPDANDDAVTTGENTAVTVDVLANDTDVDTSDTHTVDRVEIASGLGSVSITGNQVHWDPGTDYDYLAVGESALVVIDYDMSDNNGGTDSAELIITVDGVNDDPVANDDVATTDEDTPVDINVLANDTDVDANDILMASAFSALHGTVDLNNDGSLRYTPDANYFGSDTLSYTVSDGNGGTDTAEVAITVNPVNDPPISLDLPEVANEADGPFYIIQLDDQVLDVDGDNLTFSFINIDRGATPIPFEVFGADNEFIRINVEALGLDTGDSLSTQFRYLVSDGNGETDTGFVPLTINGADDAPPPANRAPLANAPSVDANEGGGTIVIPISSFASDPDGDALLVTALTGTVMGVPGSNVAFSQSEGNILIDPRQFFVQEGEPVPEDSGDLILSGGELANLALSFTVEDPAGLSASNVITLNLTGVEPDLTPRNVAPTALNIPGAPGYPSGTPDSSGPTPGTVEVDDPAVTTFTIDFDDLIGDPDNGQPGDLADPLVVTPGDLVVGFDEATGTPITVAYSFDSGTNELTVTLADFGLADGESVLASMQYEVSEGPDSTSGQIVINFANPADPEPESRVLDFESFAADPGFVIPLGTLNAPVGGDAFVPNYQGLIFQGSAAVIETNELVGGSGRDTGASGLVNGQTTPGEDSHNVLVGTFNTLRVPVTDPVTGEPVLDRNGDPLFETVQDNDFTMLAPGLRFGIGDLGPLVQTVLDGAAVLPLFWDNAIANLGSDGFDLDGLSLNAVENDNVTVTMTVWTLGEVRVDNPFNSATENVHVGLVAGDSFDFVVSASTSATEIDFNTVAGPITDVSAFDDIYAISFATDDGSAMVFDDILFTV